MIRHPKTQQDWAEIFEENLIEGIGLGNLTTQWRSVVTYPNEFLKEKSHPLNDSEFNSFDLGLLAEQMHYTMLLHNGVGLSAVQVGVLKRVITMKIPEVEIRDGVEYDIGRPYTFCNPEVVSEDRDNLFAYREGCLSVPGYFEQRVRPKTITLKWKTVRGVVMQEEFTDLEAFCILHEMDHLEGKLFIDGLSDLKRDRVRKVMNKTLRERQRQNERKRN